MALLLPGLEELWAQSAGHARVCVAILDAPVDLTHPCFKGANLKQLRTPAASTGPSAHGTHVASLIFGQGGAGSVRGVAPDCRGIVVPVFSQNPDGSLAACSQTDLARAIFQAMAAGANIINISSGELTSAGAVVDFLEDAVRQAVESNVLVVAAVGNDGCECLHVPATLPGVLAVGGTDTGGVPLAVSNWGGPLAEQGIMAPGKSIVGAVPGGKAALTGTSFSTALTSGVAALLMSLQTEKGGAFDAAAVRKAILESVVPCDAARVSNCSRMLAGTLDVKGAMNRLAPSAAAPDGVRAAGQTGNRVLKTSREPEPNREDGEKEDGENMSNFTQQGEEETAPAPAVTASALPTCQCQTASANGSAAGVRVSGSDADQHQPFPQGQKVFALGKLSYDFGTEARRDYFVSMIDPLHSAKVYDPVAMHKFLAPGEKDNNLDCAAALIWTLYVDQDPIYALVPQDQFAERSFYRLATFLRDQTEAKDPETFRVSIAGTIMGDMRLLNGAVVPAVAIVSRGLFDWDIEHLLRAAKIDDKPTKGGRAQKVADADPSTGLDVDLRNFVLRIYYELRNLGASPQDRAKNFAATNVYQARKVFQRARAENLKLDRIFVKKSPICRRDSDCWDIGLQFFNPEEVFKVARKVFEYTIDVSDLIPVQIGDAREYHVYANAAG